MVQIENITMVKPLQQAVKGTYVLLQQYGRFELQIVHSDLHLVTDLNHCFPSGNFSALEIDDVATIDNNTTAVRIFRILLEWSSLQSEISTKKNGKNLLAFID